MVKFVAFGGRSFPLCAGAAPKSVRSLLINRTKGAVSNITKGSYLLCFSQKDLLAIVPVLICVVLARGKAPSRRSC